MNKTATDRFALLVILAIITQILLAIGFSYFRWWLSRHITEYTLPLYLAAATGLLVFFMGRLTRLPHIEMNYLKSFAIGGSTLLSAWIIASVLIKTFALHPYFLYKTDRVMYTGLLLLLVALVVAGFFQQSNISFGPKTEQGDTLD